MESDSEAPCIYVYAGVNGAGKSSLGGATLRARGGNYFNPDEATRLILANDPGLPLEEANSLAWAQGLRLLKRAIEERKNFTFETTLGGCTISATLEEAARVGLEVRVWYVGLSSPELHIARVRSRVAAGGHDIPEAKIRARYHSSRENLVRLLPKLTELWVYDNSDERDPKTGSRPRPRLLLHKVGGEIVEACDLNVVPEWAKPIFVAARAI
jgi:predicted ABC-type ATPase